MPILTSIPAVHSDAMLHSFISRPSQRNKKDAVVEVRAYDTFLAASSHCPTFLRYRRLTVFALLTGGLELETRDQITHNKSFTYLLEPKFLGLGHALRLIRRYRPVCR